jgi:hypothetical protein
MNVEKGVHAEWIAWIKSTYIPLILDTGLFSENRILRLLNEEEDNTGITYSFQFFIKSLNDLEKYNLEFEEAIDTLLYKEFQGKFVEFRTILEVIE